MTSTQYAIIRSLLPHVETQDLPAVRTSIERELQRRQARRGQGAKLSDRDLLRLRHYVARMESRQRKAQYAAG